MSAPRRYFGCFTRKERWGFSRRGWLVAASLLLLAGVMWLLNVQPFLAPIRRADTNLLVVEGWVHEYAIHAATVEFQNGRYQKIYTTGGPVVGTGDYSNDFNTSASVGAELLKKAGVPDESIQMVASHEAGRDRTYNSAVALRDWLHEKGLTIRSLNVLTEDSHGRRTRLLFEKAFGSGVTVGIISVPNPDYDANHWWRYSEGVRDVLGESIAYLYARIFFIRR